MKIKNAILISACFVLACTLPSLSQQKGQWVPGQFGLNAGVIPDPGVTYANLALNYSASQLNDSNGNRILQNVTGTYSFWVDENIFYYVPEHKFLGGYFMPYIALNYANGSLVAELPPLVPGPHLGSIRRRRIRFCRHLCPASEYGLALWQTSRLQRRIFFHRPNRPIHGGSEQQRGFRILGQRYHLGHHALHHQEPRDQRELCYRLGNPRAKNGRQRASGSDSAR